MLKYGIVEFQKLVDAEFIVLSLVYIMVYGLLVDADYSGYLAVGDALLL